MSAPLCEDCRRELVRVIERLPEQYLAAFLALEKGQRYDVRAESEHAGRRGKGAHAPLPLDVEADALMGRMLEVVLSWHEAVVQAAGLSTAVRARRVVTERGASGFEAVTVVTALPRLDGETERGEFVAVRAVQGVAAVDRPADSTAGVSITTACRILAAHVDTLLGLPATAVTRTLPRSRVVSTVTVPLPSTGDAPRWAVVPVPLLGDDTLGQVRADGRALAIVELDGVEAALELFRIATDARRTLGLSRGATTLNRPCPNPDCGEPGLVLLQGADEVVCGACGERWGAGDWQRLEAVLKSGTPVAEEAS